MSSEGQQHITLADAAADVAAAGPGPSHGALYRLRAVFAAPTFITRWRQRQRPADDALSGTPDSTLTFFSLDDDDDEPKGEVSLYPMHIDSKTSSENSTPEILGATEDPSVLENPLDKVETLVEAEIEASTVSLKVDSDDVDAPKERTGKPQKRMLLLPPTAPVAVAVVRCVCWMLAQRLVRQFLEKAVGAMQRWLFANVCSRRTRLAVIGVASILWGMLVSAVSICALFVIIAGQLESVIEEAAQLGEWCDAIATTTAASFLVLHLAQVLFGALLIAASKVTGYRTLEGNVQLMEKLLLALFELMKIDITQPPPAPCNHEPPSPSSSHSSSRRGSICSHDENGKGDRDRSPPPYCNQEEQHWPSHSEAPPPFPNQSSHGHIGWVRPEERGTENGHRWPELPGNWRVPDWSHTTSNPNNSVSEPSNNYLPYPVPSNTNVFWSGSNIPQTNPGNPPYPVPNHSSYQRSNFNPNPVERDFPYPGPNLVPYNGPSTSSGGGHSIGFQTPPGVFNQTQSVEVKNFSLKVRILKRQTSPEVNPAAADEGEPEQRSGPSPVPHLLMPWLYTAWATLGTYALLSTGLATLGRGAVAAAVGALELPAVACVMDVFAELRGVPESCGCKEVRSISKGKKDKNEENVKSRSMASPPRKMSSVFDETSPLLH